MPKGEGYEAFETEPAPSLAPVDWERVTDRVSLYLQSMGVRDAVEIERLSDQVRVRLESRASSTALEDPLESAIEETIGLLDQWLVTELGLEADLGALPAARAAVLDGAMTGWSARWAGLSTRPLAQEVRARCLSPVPDPAPLVMEPSTIELCCHRLRCRIVESLGRVLCRSGPQGQSGEQG
ncbi:MAG: hypothetical protein WAM94_03820 [Chromatiaceae bacterium]